MIEEIQPRERVFKITLSHGALQGIVNMIGVTCCNERMTTYHMNKRSSDEVEKLHNEFHDLK